MNLVLCREALSDMERKIQDHVKMIDYPEMYARRYGTRDERVRKAHNLLNAGAEVEELEPYTRLIAFCVMCFIDPVKDHMKIPQAFAELEYLGFEKMNLSIHGVFEMPVNGEDFI